MVLIRIFSPTLTTALLKCNLGEVQHGHVLPHAASLGNYRQLIYLHSHSLRRKWQDSVLSSGMKENSKKKEQQVYMLEGSSSPC